MTQPRPKARTRDVLAHEIGTEVVLYDVLTNRCYTLNPSAATVWKFADGTRSAAEIAAIVEGGPDPGPAPDTVALALDELRAAGLLEPVELPAFDRRSALLRLAGAGVTAAALPAITSLVAPLPAMAQSPAAPATVCVADHHLFDADGTSEAEAFLALYGQALAYAQSVSSTNGGTYVSHSVRVARLTMSVVGGFERWHGTIVVTEVCYTVP